MKRPPDAFVAGFSLIEALAALALTATIILSLSSVAGQWIPNWSRGFLALQRTDLLGVGLERLAQDVSAAEFVTLSSEAKGPLFEGDESSVVFVRSAIGPDAYPHLEIVRIAETKDDRGLAIVRTRAPFTPAAPRGQPRDFAFRNSVVLIREPFRISLAYAGPDRVWAPTWKGQEKLPEAVRITVRDAVANRMLMASTAVTMKVTNRGAPKLETQTKSTGVPLSPGAPSPAAQATH